LVDRGGPYRVGHLLDETGLRLGLGEATKLGKLAMRWREIVGSAIADHAEPTSLKAGVLRVRTDSPVWATEISYLATEIARRANEALKDDAVVEVKVWSGPGQVLRPGFRSVTDSDETERPGPAADCSTAFDRARAAWARRTSQGLADAACEHARQRETPW
jgi:hypothetical protein